MFRCQFTRMIAVVLALPLIGLLGCAETSKVPVGSVKGKITYKGAPAPSGATVQFLSSAGAGTGQIGADGSYEAKGLRPGTYQVAVSVQQAAMDPKAAMEASQSGKKMDGTSADLPAKYQKAETSGLTTEIKEGANTFDLDMKD